jgi:NADH-quinone oxidoreductase subunit N
VNTFAASITSPTIEYGALAPMLIVIAGAIIGVLIEALSPRESRYSSQVAISLVSLVVAFIVLMTNGRAVGRVAMLSVVIDGPAIVLQGAILIFAIMGILLIAERGIDESGQGAFAAQASASPGTAAERTAVVAGLNQTEVFPLTMIAVSGMLLFPASADLLTLFVALEVLSLPLYLMSGMARRRRLLSQEAAVKYFLLGAFASAFFVFGCAFLYGYSGDLTLDSIRLASETAASNEVFLLIGIAMISVGMLFKVGAAPFQAWTPDVYQGAPTPITAFMAAATKVAAFGALLRLFYVGFGSVRWDWRPMLIVISLVTMFVGALFALTQTDVKRLLAYSSIAHAGYLLMGVVAINPEGLRASLFYLLAYGFTTIGTFAIVMLVRDATGEATHLSQWAGLGRRSPLVATVFGFLLLALAGIPLTSGFTAKFLLFSAAYQGDALLLVIAGVLTSAIAAFFYVRLIVLMFFSEPAVDGATVTIPSPLTTSVIALSTLATLILGVFPQPFIDLVKNAGNFLF